MSERDFRKGDKVLWDSGFGYEEGEYIEIKKGMFDEEFICIELTTGTFRNEIAVWKCEISHYTEEKRDELQNKYYGEK